MAPLANDGQVVLAALLAATAHDPLAVPAVLSRIRGPWALVYWQPALRRLWFGRDAIGRRSLLLCLPRPGDARLVLTSVGPLPPAAPLGDLVEVPPGLHSFDFAVLDDGGGLPTSYCSHAWTDAELIRLSAFQRPLRLVQPPDDNGTGATAELAAAADMLLVALRRAVATRCRCIVRPQCDGGRGCSNQSPLLGRERFKGEAAAVAAESPAPAGQQDPDTAPVLILFSGGVDSALLAALTHEALPPEAPIDLVSVCFDGGRSPDRCAALDALAELRAACPGRRWRLIKADCSLADVDAIRPRLEALLSPQLTVMDANIGAALWLAARGTGVLHQKAAAGRCSAEPPGGSCDGGDGSVGPDGGGSYYTSAARIVLLGHGADELCGGYGRHRTRFREAGWVGLGDELALDTRRLWLRNLGRDDRVVADHGREGRHPYLDEQVVGTALGLPLRALADLRLPPGAGDKRALRACAARLGLPRAAARVKRAIQFGTRLGQQANRRDFGSGRRANACSGGSMQLAELQRQGNSGQGWSEG